MVKVQPFCHDKRDISIKAKEIFLSMVKGTTFLSWQKKNNDKRDAPVRIKGTTILCLHKKENNSLSG